jgi:adenine-specific DNA-methyltransferase
VSMDRVPNETADGRAELLEKLRDLLPAAFPDGTLDIGALCAALDLAKPDKPSFSFSWQGMDRARLEARLPTAATLVPDRDASVNWDITRDILIEGDNLQVVKILKAGHSGSAKLIFMDPPYNTGDTFIYKDDLGVPEPQYLKTTGRINEPASATTTKVEDSGGKHAPWMNMVFPRLVASRPLLRRDGVILVTTDDNEVHHLRLLLDLVFGEANFVGTFVWNSGRRGEASRICGVHDYIVVYALDLQFLRDEGIRWRARKPGLDEVYEKAEQLRAEYQQNSDTIHQELLKWYDSLPEEHPSKAHELFNHVDAQGVYSHEDLPGARVYLNEHEEWAPASVFYQDYRLGIKAFNDLLGREIFDYARDTDVLGRMIEAITGDGDLIIDLFAGSGSTGHAVWKQNQADGKVRHWLLVQAPEPPDDMLKAWKRVFAAGYETVFELAADRLRRAAQQLQEGIFIGPQLGFRIFRARPTNMVMDPPMFTTDRATDKRYAEAPWGQTEGEPMIEDADTIAVAWEVALKTGGTRLDAPVRQLNIDGVIVYEFASAENQGGDRRLFVSFDEFSMATALELKLTDADTLILRGDKVDDAASKISRLPSKLILLGRVPREA